MTADIIVPLGSNQLRKGIEMQVEKFPFFNKFLHMRCEKMIVEILEMFELLANKTLPSLEIVSFEYYQSEEQLVDGLG